jgi:hypothetical protein
MQHVSEVEENGAAQQVGLEHISRGDPEAVSLCKVGRGDIAIDRHSDSTHHDVTELKLLPLIVRG